MCLGPTAQLVINCLGFLLLFFSLEISEQTFQFIVFSKSIWCSRFPFGNQINVLIIIFFFFFNLFLVACSFQLRNYHMMKCIASHGLCRNHPPFFINMQVYIIPTCTQKEKKKKKGEILSFECCFVLLSLFFFY